MINKSLQKVTSDHLRRKAYLYVRQSTLKQVIENTESTKRQYAIRDRAIALGWPIEQIELLLNTSTAKIEVIFDRGFLSS